MPVSGLREVGRSSDLVLWKIGVIFSPKLNSRSTTGINGQRSYKNLRLVQVAMKLRMLDNLERFQLLSFASSVAREMFKSSLTTVSPR